MKLTFKEPCSTKVKIRSLLVELGFWQNTHLPDWVRLANDDLDDLDHNQAEEKLEQLQFQHRQLIRIYESRWLRIIKTFKNQ